MDAITDYCFKSVLDENVEDNNESNCDDFDSEYYSPEGPWMKQFLVPNLTSNIGQITNEPTLKSLLTSSSSKLTVEDVADCTSKADSKTNDIRKYKDSAAILKASDLTHTNSNNAKSILRDMSTCSSLKLESDSRLSHLPTSCSSTNSLILPQNEKIKTNFTCGIGILWCRLDEKTDINITVDNAIRVKSEYGFAISVSGSGDKVALIHPSGKVRCLDGKLQAVFEHPIRFVNMNQKEITAAKKGDEVGFVIRNDSHAAYKDSYIEMSNNIIDDLFLTHSKHGSDFQKEYRNVLNSCKILSGETGVKYFRFGSVEMVKFADKKIEVRNQESKMLVELFTEQGFVRIRTCNLMISFGIQKQIPFYIKFIDAIVHFNNETFLATFGKYSVALY